MFTGAQGWVSGAAGHQSRWHRQAAQGAACPKTKPYHVHQNMDYSVCVSAPCAGTPLGGTMPKHLLDPFGHSPSLERLWNEMRNGG
eukprot:239004-Heterocapsa_arctica.AAC.1